MTVLTLKAIVSMPADIESTIDTAIKLVSESNIDSVTFEFNKVNVLINKESTRESARVQYSKQFFKNLEEKPQYD